MKNKHDERLNMTGLMTLVMTTIIGSGIFNLSKEMASVASVRAVLIGWLITGLGMGALALSMQGVSRLRPDLESGIFSYAKEGFGSYIGFNSAWGYWVSNIIKNGAYGSLLFSALAYFFPVFGQGQNLASFIGASCVLWLIHYLVLKGSRSTQVFNLIILLAKLSPIVLFLIVISLTFKMDLFQTAFWNQVQANQGLNGLTSQVKDTMLVTVFSFIGLESAVALSGKAKSQHEVGRATVLAFVAVTLIYALVTLLAYGTMTRQELATLHNPAMAYILEKVLGPWAAGFVNIGIMISIFGAWFSSTFLCEEVVYQSAKQGLFPQVFNQRNDRLISVPSLTISTLLIQALFLTFLLVPNAYSNLTKLSSATILFSYACIAFFYLKSLQAQSDSAAKRRGQVIGWLAAIYMIWLIYASGPKFMMLTVISLFPGSLIYLYREYKQGRPMVKTYEWAVLALIAIGFVYSLGHLSMIFS